MKRIKKNDTVIIIAGKSKNHVGKVLRVLDNKILVEGANLIKKHVKPNPQAQEPGGIKTMEAPFHSSNAALYNPITQKADKVGFKFITAEGKTNKVRYFKSNQELVDLV